MENKKKQSLELSQAHVLRQDLRLFSMLASSEEDFLGQSAELEADPLFARLCVPGPGGAAPVIRKKLPGASYAFSSACGDDALASAVESGGAGEWLADRPAMLELAHRAGALNFERYFLSDSSFRPEAAARACGFTQDEAAALKSFANAFILAHERVQPKALPELYLRCSAVISSESGQLSAAYTHPSYFRGAYSIDRRALAGLIKSGALTAAESRRASTLLSRAQRLAWRRSGFHRVLSAILEAQAGFLLRKSGLKPLTQRELASRAGLNPATVSRLIADKTLMTPWGDEIRLKDFFYAKSAFITDKIRELLASAPSDITDREIAERLRRDFGFRISRRSVNLYRTRLQ